VARHRKAEPVDGEFRLLFVCTGNICRSPFAEILTRHLLVGRLGGRVAGRFDVSSAGVQAVVGSPMHPDSQAELAPWGLHRAAAAGFTAQQLRSSTAASAHLVLGVSPEHRSAVVEYAPAALATAFSLGEFARLVTSIDRSGLPTEPVARAHALVEAAWMNRGLTPPADPLDDLVPDPIGRPREAHHEAAALILAAVRRIVDVIAPSPAVAVGTGETPARTAPRAGLNRQ
jgi:protein-tyrosine phosphatase